MERREKRKRRSINIRRIKRNIHQILAVVKSLRMRKRSKLKN
jgi:hypothetical protein